MFQRTLWMLQNGSFPAISSSVNNVTYSLLCYSETHGDDRFRTRLKAHFPVVQILNPTDVLQELGQFLYSYNEIQRDALFLRFI
jgi:hypothetical protein